MSDRLRLCRHEVFSMLYGDLRNGGAPIELCRMAPRTIVCGV